MSQNLGMCLKSVEFITNLQIKYAINVFNGHFGH